MRLGHAAVVRRGPRGYERPVSVRVLMMVISIALSALVGLVLARGGNAAKVGPASAAADPHAKVTIGLSLDTLKEARWQADRDLFVARAAELGAETLVQSANSDDTRQMQDVEALLSRNVDVL